MAVLAAVQCVVLEGRSVVCLLAEGLVLILLVLLLLLVAADICGVAAPFLCCASACVTVRMCVCVCVCVCVSLFVCVYVGSCMQLQ